MQRQRTCEGYTLHYNVITSLQPLSKYSHPSKPPPKEDRHDFFSLHRKHQHYCRAVQWPRCSTGALSPMAPYMVRSLLSTRLISHLINSRAATLWAQVSIRMSEAPTPLMYSSQVGRKSPLPRVFMHTTIYRENRTHATNCDLNTHAAVYTSHTHAATVVCLIPVGQSPQPFGKSRTPPFHQQSAFHLV